MNHTAVAGTQTSALHLSLATLQRRLRDSAAKVE
jgi:hypothetical protein